MKYPCFNNNVLFDLNNVFYHLPWHKVSQDRKFRAYIEYVLMGVGVKEEAFTKKISSHLTEENFSIRDTKKLLSRIR